MRPPHISASSTALATNGLRPHLHLCSAWQVLNIAHPCSLSPGDQLTANSPGSTSVKLSPGSTTG